MAGPLSKFIGRDRDGNSFEIVKPAPQVKSEPDKFVISPQLASPIEVKAWAHVRYSQEIAQLQKQICDIQSEITSVIRRQSKLFVGLDKSQIAAMMDCVNKITFTPAKQETIEEPDEV